MTTLHFSKTATLTPEQFTAALIRFGPGRSKVFSKSADDYLEVHALGWDYADVTEGSSGVWERLHYDWSVPHQVVIKTTDSNVWGGASGYTYTLVPRPDDLTNVDVVIVREGKNLTGRFLALFLGTVGKVVLRKAFVHSVNVIEARYHLAVAR